MNLEEHFKDRPELLEEPLVKSLIEYMQGRFTATAKIASTAIKSANDFELKVLEMCLYSEVVLIGGTPCRQVVEELLAESSK